MKYLEIFERFYQPPSSVKEKLDQIVTQLLATHKGGVEFFAALDDAVKDIINEDIVLALLRGSTNQWIATSGGFGDRLYRLWQEKKFKCKGIVVFNGKMMTNNIGVKNWYPSEFEIKDKDFIYFDDSYFSGGTYHKIDNFLRTHNSLIKSVHVIYDGSKVRSKFVKSFFRYYK